MIGNRGSTQATPLLTGAAALLLLLSVSCASATPSPRPVHPAGSQVLAPGGGALPTMSPAELLDLPADFAEEWSPDPVTMPSSMGSVTEPVPQTPVVPRPGPGVRDLADLGHSQPPARRASLSLTQDARLAYLNQEPVAARHQLESAVQLWGRNPYALYYLGLLELDDRNYANARDYARTAIEHIEDSPGWLARFYLLLGEAETRLGNPHEAAVARSRAHALDRNAVLR